MKELTATWPHHDFGPTTREKKDYATSRWARAKRNKGQNSPWLGPPGVQEDWSLSKGTPWGTRAAPSCWPTGRPANVAAPPLCPHTTRVVRRRRRQVKNRGPFIMVGGPRFRVTIWALYEFCALSKPAGSLRMDGREGASPARPGN